MLRLSSHRNILPLTRISQRCFFENVKEDGKVQAAIIRDKLEESQDQTKVEKIGNNSSVKDVMNIINDGKIAQFNEGSYHNLLCLYRGLKKKTALSASPPYHKSKADLYRFLLKRRILQRDILNKLQVYSSRTAVKAEATIEVKGSAKAVTFPKLPLDIQLDPSLVHLEPNGSGYTSFHFLSTYRSCYKRLVPVKELGKDAELAVGYGVFPPTRKDYLRLFDEFFHQWCRDNRRSIHQKSFPLTIIDVGCGSGVLGFLTLKHLSENIQNEALRIFLLGVDKYHEAVYCCSKSSALLDNSHSAYFLQSSKELFPTLSAVPNSVRQLPLARHIKALKDNKYDIILCNPPWLPTDIDNESEKGEIGSFSDSYVFEGAEEGKPFMESFFSQAAAHLKEDGRIFMIHSNLGHLIGIQEKDYIQKLCEENSLTIRSIFETPAKVKFSQSDWFADEKAESKVFLFEISHFTGASLSKKTVDQENLMKE